MKQNKNVTSFLDAYDKLEIYSRYGMINMRCVESTFVISWKQLAISLTITITMTLKMDSYRMAKPI